MFLEDFKVILSSVIHPRRLHQDVFSHDESHISSNGNTAPLAFTPPPPLYPISLLAAKQLDHKCPPTLQAALQLLVKQISTSHSSMWLVLHASWRPSVAARISWIAGKLAGWLALSETIVCVCLTPTTLGSGKERGYVSVCVCAAGTIWSRSPYLHSQNKGEESSALKGLVQRGMKNFSFLSLTGARTQEVSPKDCRTTYITHLLCTWWIRITSTDLTWTCFSKRTIRSFIFER